MSQVETDNVLREKIRHLAIEQMSEGVISIVMTRVANGSIEVNIVRDWGEFGRRLAVTSTSPARNSSPSTESARLFAS